VHEEQGAVLVGVVTEDDAEPAPAQELRQALLAVAERQRAEASPSSSSRSKAYSMAAASRRGWRCRVEAISLIGSNGGTVQAAILRQHRS
jgi:hypothetical protein